jgi:HIRAN domain-containing protein
VSDDTLSDALNSSPPAPQRVTLTKAERATTAGIELVALLTELSDDGVVTRDELARLRAWLEVDRGVNFAACPFLHEVIDRITSDGEITEDELDTLASAIERVLPPEIRKHATERRKQQRTARREALKAARQAERAAMLEARERARPLHRGDFIVAGAGRSAERRAACESLRAGARVVLEREPDNRHDANAILILNTAGDELGYVPREDAAVMAPLLDAGGWVEATVKKVIEARSGHTLPVIVSTMYRHGVERPTLAPATSMASSPSRIIVGDATVGPLSFGTSERRVSVTPSHTGPVAVQQRARYWIAIAFVLAAALALYLLAG